jgi:hypothetical protein
LSFDREDVAELYCAGIAEDRSLRQPEVIFHCRSTRTRGEIIARLDRTEHHDVWSSPAEAHAISRAFQDADAFTPVAIATLLLFGLKRFGKDWFARESKRFARSSS